MEITEVKVFPIHEEKLKAFVSVVFDHCFMVNDIKVIRGKEGLFISMPSRKKKNGEFKDVAHPLNNETRRMLEERILGEYERVLAERGERADQPAVEPAAGEAEPVAATLAEVPQAPIVAMSEPAAPAAALAAEPPAVEAEVKAEPVDRHEEESPERSLEEVEEMHLRDSFWTVT